MKFGQQLCTVWPNTAMFYGSLGLKLQVKLSFRGPEVFARKPILTKVTNLTIHINENHGVLLKF